MEVQVVDYTAPDAAQKFTQSLHETGFGVLKRPIPQELVERIYARWLDFFDSDDKAAFAFNPRDARRLVLHRHLRGQGLQPEGPEGVLPHLPVGRIPPALRDDALDYFQRANALASELLTWVEALHAADIAQHYSEPLSKMIEGSRHPCACCAIRRSRAGARRARARGAMATSTC